MKSKVQALFDWLKLYVQLDTKYVILETLFPANLLASS